MATLRKDPAPAQSAGTVLPRFVGESVDDQDASTISPATAPPFVLVWARGDYQILGPDRRVLPRLVQHRLDEGVAGVRRRRDGNWDVDGLVSDSRQARKQVIPSSLGYCVGAAGYPDCWRPVWSEVRGGAIVEDQRAYQAWVESLYDSGEIPRPTADQCRALAERHDSLCAMDPNKGGHSREMTAYAAMRDAALAAAEVAS
jgi:hypothetical protein